MKKYYEQQEDGTLKPLPQISQAEEAAQNYLKIKYMGVPPLTLEEIKFILFEM